MSKRTLAMGLLALALNAHASPEATAGEGTVSPQTLAMEAADEAAHPAEGLAAPAFLAAPSRPEALAYALIGLGLLVGLLVRRRR